MTNKYLVFNDYSIRMYVCTNDAGGYEFTSLDRHADQYDLDEAIKIRTMHPDWMLEFKSICAEETSPKIFIRPIEADRTDFDVYAKVTAKQWDQSVSYYRHFIEAPENQEKMQQAIARLNTHIAKAKQSENYKFHRVTYVGIPPSMSDYDIQNFAPYFSLAINYGSNDFYIVNFLIK